MHGWCYLPFRTHPDAGRSPPDVNQHAARARQVDIFQQRRRDSHFSSFFRTVFTARHARTHHCVAHLRHYGAYVCKVHVHQTRTSNQFSDTLHSAFQYIVRCAKRIQQEIPRPRTFSSLSFGIVIRESTCLDSSVIPCSANAIRFLPSKLKGLVTTATVRIPKSFATSATTGAAPVPVPPPIPAAIKTMSAPSSAARNASRSHQPHCY